MTATKEEWKSRNLISFWIFGVCNNFAYIVMLTAAQDILHKHQKTNTTSEVIEQCEPKIIDRSCSPHSASLVLLCNILPGLIIKILYPFIASRVPYGVRHAIVCILQAASLIITALADSVPIALAGVSIGSVGSGMGESTYLGLASHYTKHSISAWASGTGMAGIAGAFSYAGLTDPHLLALSPTNAMLATLVVPSIFVITYYCILQQPETVKKVSVFEPISWIGLDVAREKRKSMEAKNGSSADEIPSMEIKTVSEKMEIAKSLLKYMIPLFLVYFAEYLINQGLVELTTFDCAHGFGTSLRSQYRWYQVLYQVGVFISRSSTNLVQLNMTWLMILPVLQLLNTIFFLFNAIYSFVPHFGIVAGIVLYEGLIGGGAYVNSYNHIHKKVDPSIREFALSVVTLADTAGILVAALTALPIHNAICEIPML